MAYSPPLTITPRLITLVSEISELIGHLALTRDGELAPQITPPGLSPWRCESRLYSRRSRPR